MPITRYGDIPLKIRTLPTASFFYTPKPPPPVRGRGSSRGRHDKPGATSRPPEKTSPAPPCGGRPRTSLGIWRDSNAPRTAGARPKTARVKKDISFVREPASRSAVAVLYFDALLATVTSPWGRRESGGMIISVCGGSSSGPGTGVGLIGRVSRSWIISAAIQ
jgi:hypothetical protein